MLGNSLPNGTDKAMRLDPLRGPNLRVFFGPDSTYFAVDGKPILPYARSS